MRNYFTPFGASLILLAFFSVIISFVLLTSASDTQPIPVARNEEERTNFIRAASGDLIKSLEEQVEIATGRKADCQITMIVELIPEKTYRAIVLCTDGKLTLTNVVDVTKFGTDDQLFWQTNGFDPAKKQPRPL